MYRSQIPNPNPFGALALDGIQVYYRWPKYSCIEKLAFNEAAKACPKMPEKFYDNVTADPYPGPKGLPYTAADPYRIKPERIPRYNPCKVKTLPFCPDPPKPMQPVTPKVPAQPAPPPPVITAPPPPPVVTSPPPKPPETTPTPVFQTEMERDEGTFAPEPEPEDDEEEDNTTMYVVGGVLALVVVGGGFAYYVSRKKKGSRR